MFRSRSSDHHQGSITVLVQLPLIGVHASSYSGMWLYVVCTSVLAMYLSMWCLVIYCPVHDWVIILPINMMKERHRLPETLPF
jgi:hypothetical protein